MINIFIGGRSSSEFIANKKKQFRVSNIIKKVIDSFIIVKKKVKIIKKNVDFFGEWSWKGRQRRKLDKAWMEEDHSRAQP
jgi:hypothetical protein